MKKKFVVTFTQPGVSRRAPQCDAPQPLWSYIGGDTLIIGQTLNSGRSLYTHVGHYLELQSDGNLCASDEKAKNIGVQCPRTMAITVRIPPICLQLERFRCTMQRVMFITLLVHRVLCIWCTDIQNDGNIVSYLRSDNGSPLWSSNITFFP